MPYSGVSGPLGLQGRHQWNDNFMLNDLESGFPFADLDRITGLFSLPEVEDKRDPKIADDDEVVYPSFTRGKTVTYEGRLLAADGDQLPGYRWTMLQAFADQSNEGYMKISPHASWGSGTWRYYARVLACDIDDEIFVTNLERVPTAYQVKFILSLRMKNNNFDLL